MIAKVQGNIVDILYPPLSPMEVTAAMLLGAITRGLVIGFFSVLIIIPFAHIPVHNIFIILILINKIPILFINYIHKFFSYSLL